MPLLALRATSGATAVVPAGTRPTITAEIAYGVRPFNPFPTWTNVSAYLRSASSQRGRNYEYDRTETGAARMVLSNRDSRFNPDNTAGAYYPNLRPNRRARLRAVWDATYELFHGFTKGYPQQFPEAGFDATVDQDVRDAFYPLNMTKFTPGTTTLTRDITTAPAVDTVETIFTIANMGLPMPQAAPFTITIDDEDMEVTSVVFGWTVKRGQNGTVPAVHAAGATISTRVVRFAEETSGQRVVNVLTLAGVPTSDMAVGTGVSRISASDDLAGQNMLEHLQLVAEAENGRLFVSSGGKITFQDRHWALQNERSDRATFNDIGTGLPYQLAGPVEHDESKIFNVIRITPGSGNTQTARDSSSVNENFERVLEKQWPLASDVEAQAAAEWMLLKLKDATVRIPRVTLQGQASPATMWPTLLGMDIGQRYAFRYTPRGGGDPITRSVTVEGVGHTITPSDHTVHVDFSPADTTVYWRVGVAGYSEAGQTTRATY